MHVNNLNDSHVEVGKSGVWFTKLSAQGQRLKPMIGASTETALEGWFLKYVPRSILRPIQKRYSPDTPNCAIQYSVEGKILPDFMLYRIQIDRPVILPKVEQPQMLFFFFIYKYLIPARNIYAASQSDISSSWAPQVNLTLLKKERKKKKSLIC